MVLISGYCAFNLVTESFRSIGVSSAIATFSASKFCMRIWPQKLNTLLLMDCLKPLAKAIVNIITATLMTVAAMDKRITNREKDRCWLKAILLAMNLETFKR